jgi:hypothetical protein
MMTENLKHALAQAEKSASNMEIDQIAWLIGNFPQNPKLRDCASGCPRIEKLLPEMTPCRSETEALLLVADAMERDDVVGAVADKIRKVVRS